MKTVENPQVTLMKEIPTKHQLVKLLGRYLSRESFLEYNQKNFKRALAQYRKGLYEYANVREYEGAAYYVLQRCGYPYKVYTGFMTWLYDIMDDGELRELIRHKFYDFLVKNDAFCAFEKGLEKCSTTGHTTFETYINNFDDSPFQLINKAFTWADTWHSDFYWRELHGKWGKCLKDIIMRDENK